MEKEQFTEGEWHVYHNQIVVDRGNSYIVICDGLKMYNDESKANADLIKAAPAMSNAIRAARKKMLRIGVNAENADIYNLLDHAFKLANPQIKGL